MKELEKDDKSKGGRGNSPRGRRATAMEQMIKSNIIAFDNPGLRKLESNAKDGLRKKNEEIS